MKKIKKKKTPKKQKKSVQRKTKHEIVVRVTTDQSTPLARPTEQDIIEPIKDGRKLALPKTWMSQQQIIHVVQRTPAQHVYRRKGKGGHTFDYVTGAYVGKVLNFVFGWNWDFEITQHGKEGNCVWVLGKLTVRGTQQGQQIVKSQFGRAEIKYLKGTKDFVDFGNDLKAAATDSLKKCSSLLGVASDIYGKDEYKSETGNDVSEPQVEVKQLAAKIDNPVECVGATKKGCPEGNIVTEAQNKFTTKLHGRALCKNCYSEIKK